MLGKNLKEVFTAAVYAVNIFSNRQLLLCAPEGGLIPLFTIWPKKENSDTPRIHFKTAVRYCVCSCSKLLKIKMSSKYTLQKGR